MKQPRKRKYGKRRPHLKWLKLCVAPPSGRFSFSEIGKKIRPKLIQTIRLFFVWTKIKWFLKLKTRGGPILKSKINKIRFFWDINPGKEINVNLHALGSRLIQINPPASQTEMTLPASLSPVPWWAWPDPPSRSVVFTYISMVLHVIFCPLTSDWLIMGWRVLRLYSEKKSLAALFS